MWSRWPRNTAVARNLGGRVDVSLANTELVRRSQLHEARLTEHIFPSSPLYQETVGGMTKFLTTQGTPSADAHHQALGLLDRMIEQQASLLAYMDVFWAYAIFAALMIAVAFVLRNVDTSQRAVAL